MAEQDLSGKTADVRTGVPESVGGNNVYGEFGIGVDIASALVTGQEAIRTNFDEAGRALNVLRLETNQVEKFLAENRINYYEDSSRSR